MAEKSLFYNAFPDDDSETGYDRNYNADDISDFISVIFDTGVVKTDTENAEPQGLKVIAQSGLKVAVKAGKATIRGKGYINNSLLTLSLATAPTGTASRYDMVVLRMDNTQTKSGRKTYVTIVTGTADKPTTASLTRTADIYDLLLAYIEVAPNATSISQANITDCRGDKELCPWLTAVKGYEDYYDAIIQRFYYKETLATATTTITTDLASTLYNERYSLVEVYSNGLREEKSDYTVSTNGGHIVITFSASKSKDTEVAVVLSNFIDGEGLSTALEDYSKWVNAVANLQTANEFNYICNGKTDNVEITNLVNAFINGGSDYAEMKLNIIGKFGYTYMVGGSGTSASPYKLFSFANGNRRVTLDFSNSAPIKVNISGVYAVVFDTSAVTINNANIIINGNTAGTSVEIFNAKSGAIVCNNCRFFVTAYQDSKIAYTGTFNNCRGSVANSINASYCFISAGLLRVNGGEYYAYTGDSAKKSAVVGQSAGGAVSILRGINAPVVHRSGFYQTNSILQYIGGGTLNCYDMVTTLTDVITSGSVVNTIKLNKPNYM